MVSDREHQILLQQYNLSVAQTKDLREQLSQKQEQWDRREEDHKITIKLMRELCESILAKSPEQNSLGKSESWDSMNTNDMINLSKKVYKEYNEKRTEIMRKTNDDVEARGEKIRELEEEIIFLKRHNGKSANETTDDEMGEDEKAKRRAKKEKDDVEKAKNYMSPDLQKKIEEGKITVEVARELKEDLNNGNVQIEFEDIDEEVVEGDKTDELHAENLINNITAKVTPRSVRTFHGPKGNKKRKEAREKAVDEVYSEELKEITEKMTDEMWVMVKIIGETGESKLTNISGMMIDELYQQNKTISPRQVLGKAVDLHNLGVILKQNVITPISAKMSVVTLTEIGAVLYKKHFKADYIAMSEYDKIIAEHTTPEHGYGIQQCAEIISNTKIDKKKIYVKVDIWNRKKPISVSSADGKSSIYYIPDIVCIDKNNNKTYIEYELNHHTKHDFNAKCNKMILAGIDKLNFIVNNVETAKELNERLLKWVETKGNSEIIRHLTMRVTTAKALNGHDIRQDREWMFVCKPINDKEFIKNF